MKKIIFGLLLFVSACFGQTTWTDQSPSGVTDDIWCVKYANETFVAVTGKGKVLTSTDGVSWSVQTLVANTWLVSVTFGGGLWVVVGDGGVIYYSADLKNWNAAKAVTTTKLNGVGYNGTVFVAVGESGVIVTSTDAQNWTVRSSGTSNYLHGIQAAPSSGNLLVTGGKGTILESTSNGVSWRTSSPSWSITPPATVAEDFEAIAATHSPLSGTGYDQFVLVGGNGIAGTLNYSFNGGRGDTYFGAIQSLSGFPVLRGLVYGGGSWVAAGSGGAIFTSPDGKKWTQRFSGDSPATVTSTTLLSVTFSEDLQKFVAVGANGKILVSSPPPTTIINVATRGTVVPTDPLIGGFVISGTAQKNVLIRAVGPTLSGFGVAMPLADPILTVYNSKNQVVATNTGWTTSTNLTALVAATLRSAFPLAAGSKDSALYLTLDPGAYTATVRSASKGTGTVLFEAYSP